MEIGETEVPSVQPVPEQPDQPEEPDPEQPEEPDPEQPEQPDPEQPEEPDPEQPEEPDPEQPEEPDPEQPEEPDPVQPEEPDPVQPEEPQWPASMASGTLPIMYINTEDAAPILDKVTKIPAGLWIEIPEGCEDKQFALGSEEDPVKLEIRGRGNSTWEKPKKPYKLKFDKKTEIMGMPKHKHFALLAHYGASNSWQSMVLGFEMARNLEMPWTPHFEAVELVLNGSYEGLYFLVESVKIDKNRINIYEQPEENTDPETIPYGWLVEIDNYPDEFQIKVPYGENRELSITHKSPELLSDMQREWLINEFTQISETINNKETVEDWVNHFDAQSLAKYFIIREVMNDYDGFSGSTYLTKDLGSDKWAFGPLWDPSFCYLANEQEIDWTKNLLPNYLWWKILPQVFNTQSFNDAFLQEWENFYPEKFEPLLDVMNKWYDKVNVAFNITRERWDNQYSATNPNWITHMFKLVSDKAKWMDDHKNFYVADVVDPDPVDPDNPDPVDPDNPDPVDPDNPDNPGKDDVGINAPTSSAVPVAVVYYTTVGTIVAHPAPGNLYIKVAHFPDGTTRAAKIRY